MPQAIPASKRTANIISSAGRGYRDTSSGTRYLGRGVEADVHLPTATVREAERSRAHAIRDGQEGGHELGEFQLQRRHRFPLVALKESLRKILTTTMWVTMV